MKLDATRISNGWAIRPLNALGTCGWIDGMAWTVSYVTSKPPHIPVRV